MWKHELYYSHLPIDQKDQERERARLSRDGEGRAPHHPTPSRDSEERATREVGGGGLGGLRALRGHGWARPSARLILQVI